jgi:hypothetical protein
LPGGGETPGKGYADVTFDVTVPTDSPGRAYTRVDLDVDIRNVDLFVFDATGSGSFVERVPATAIVLQSNVAATGAATYKITARLSVSATQRTVFFVANARDAAGNDRVVIPGGLAGKNHQQIMWDGHSTGGTAATGMRTVELSPVASASGNSLDDIAPIIMWGVLRMPTISSTNNITSENVKLLRAVAAINVVDYGTGGAGIANFQILSVSAGNVATSSLVAPYKWLSNSWSNSPGYHNTPTEGAATLRVTNHFGASSTSGYWSAAGQMHYVNESIGTNPFVIIHASYQQGGVNTNYYYKVDLKNPSGVPLNIVRNHRYTMRITSVTGPGYTNLADAVANPPANGVIVALVDEHPELVSFAANSEEYMGITNGEAYLAYRGPATFEIAKVYTSREEYNLVNNSNSIITSIGLSGGGTLELTKSGPDPTGLVTISGAVTGTASGTGSFKISDGGSLGMTINVTVANVGGWTASSGGGTWITTDTGVIQTGNTPWTVEVLNESPNAPRNVFMTTVWNQNGSSNPITSGSNWNVTWSTPSYRTYSGSTSTILFLHVPASGRGDFIGTLKHTYMDSSGQVAVKYYRLKGTR